MKPKVIVDELREDNNNKSVLTTSIIVSSSPRIAVTHMDTQHTQEPSPHLEGTSTLQPATVSILAWLGSLLYQISPSHVSSVCSQVHITEWPIDPGINGLDKWIM